MPFFLLLLLQEQGGRRSVSQSWDVFSVPWETRLRAVGCLRTRLQIVLLKPPPDPTPMPHSHARRSAGCKPDAFLQINHKRSLIWEPDIREHHIQRVLTSCLLCSWSGFSTLWHSAISKPAQQRSGRQCPAHKSRKLHLGAAGGEVRQELFLTCVGTAL